MDKTKIKIHVRGLIESIGEDPDRQGLKKTPDRIAEMYEKIFSAGKKPLKEIFQFTHEIEHDEMVLVKDIPFYSLCEHHLMPFFGKCHIGYIPKDSRIVGIGRMAEFVHVMSSKLQVQEILTTEMANLIMKELKPKGVGVVMQARHLCLEMMSHQHIGTEIMTSAVRGLFRNDIKTREEFLKLIK